MPIMRSCKFNCAWNDNTDFSEEIGVLRLVVPTILRIIPLIGNITYTALNVNKAVLYLGGVISPSFHLR